MVVRTVATEFLRSLALRAVGRTFLSVRSDRNVRPTSWELHVNAAQVAGSRRRVVILGSTGSIGTSCLKVIDHLPDRLEALGLSAHARWEDLIQQAQKYKPRYVAATDGPAARAP